MVDWVAELVGGGGAEDQALKQVSDNYEKVGGQGVPLAETILTVYPRARDPVKEDGSLA